MSKNGRSSARLQTAPGPAPERFFPSCGPKGRRKGGPHTSEKMEGAADVAIRCNYNIRVSLLEVVLAAISAIRSYGGSRVGSESRAFQCSNHWQDAACNLGFSGAGPEAEGARLPLPSRRILSEERPDEFVEFHKDREVEEKGEGHPQRCPRGGKALSRQRG